MHRNLRLTVIGLPPGDRETLLVELGLRRLEGVFQVHVEPETQTAHLHFDPERTSAELVAERIRELGYETHMADEMTAAHAGGPEALPQVLDVVCGAVVFLHETVKVHRAVVSGRAYFFCSSDCHDAFRASPERYVSGSGGAAAGPAVGAPGKIALPVVGLSCGGGGALQLEKEIQRLPGVVSAYVNPVTETAYVEYRHENVTVDQIAHVIRASGYETSAAAHRSPREI